MTRPPLSDEEAKLASAIIVGMSIGFILAGIVITLVAFATSFV